MSAQTAQPTAVDVSSAAPASSLKGFIWIGDCDKTTKKWTRVKLLPADSNAPLSAGPDAIAPGAVYAVSAHIVLRDGLPDNDDEYFRARRSIGVLPTGTRVLAQSRAVGIDREFAVQHWLEVAAQR